MKVKILAEVDGVLYDLKPSGKRNNCFRCAMENANCTKERVKRLPCDKVYYALNEISDGDYIISKRGKRKCQK